MIRKLGIISIFLVIIISVFSVCYAESITLDRKSTKDIEVAEANRLPISMENRVNWKTSNDKVVSFVSYNDYKATIRAEDGGTATITCTQASQEVFSLTVTVPKQEAPNSKLLLGKNYYLRGTTGLETTDTEISPKMSVIGRSYLISPENGSTILDSDSNGLLINTNKVGTFDLIYHNGLAGTGPRSQMDSSGHVEYSNGAAFSWNDLICHFEVINGYKIEFDSNGGTGSMSFDVVEKGTSYKLPKCTFKAPDGLTFGGWLVNRKTYEVGDSVVVTSNLNVKAVWSVKSTSISLNRKDTKEVSVAEANRKEISVENQIIWNTSDTKIVNFESANDFDAVIRAAGVGTATVTCKQGDTVVYSATVKVKDNSEKPPEYTLALNSYYIVPGYREATEDSMGYVSAAMGGPSNQIVDDDKCIEVVQKSTYDILVKTIKTGTFNVTHHSSGYMPPRPAEMTNGHYSYSNPHYVWVDVIGVYKVIDGYKVSFDSNNGVGNMDSEIVEKGSTYKLPKCTFTGPNNSEFDCWEVSGKTYAPGKSITINENTTVKALWKITPQKIELKRKSTMDITVPEDNRKTISSQNRISWQTSDDKIVSFTSYKDFDATIRGENAGTAVITCRQGNGAVYSWNITVPKEDKDIKTYTLLLGRTYYLGGSGRETTDTSIEPKMSRIGLSYNVSPDKYVEVIDSDSNSIIVKTIKTGKFDLIKHDGLAGTGPRMTITSDGHAEYSNGAAYSWDDVVATYEIIDGYKVSFDANGGTGTMADEYVQSGKRITLPKCTFKAPEGMEFDKWDKGTSGKSITIKEDTVLVAQWTKATAVSGTTTTDEKEEYMVTTKASAGGTISPKNPIIEKGKSQEFTFKANKGYEISNVIVDKASYGKIESYRLDNISSSHKIEVEFVKVETTSQVETPSTEAPVTSKFKDVSQNDWFYNNVNYVVAKGLIKGKTEESFAPNDRLTRGMLVTILYRYADASETSKATFNDVDSNMYYSEPIAWAASHSIVYGVDDSTFEPDKDITRQDLITIIYRYIKNKNGFGVANGSNKVSEYKDYGEVNGYALEPFEWALEKGIITGRENSMLAPSGFATRAETAAIMERIIESN